MHIKDSADDKSNKTYRNSWWTGTGLPTFEELKGKKKGLIFM